MCTFQCLTATETLKTPHQDSGLCRSSLLYQQLALWVSAVSSMCLWNIWMQEKAQEGYFVLFLASLQRLLFSLPPSLTRSHFPCVSPRFLQKWNRLYWIPSSITEKAPLLVMQSGRQSKKTKRPGIWHDSSHVELGEEECSILYAGRISLIEVSARENCGCMRVNVWVQQRLHSSRWWWGIWPSSLASFDCVCTCADPPRGDSNCKTYHLVYLWCWGSKVEAASNIITLHHQAITLRIHN